MKITDLVRKLSIVLVCVRALSAYLDPGSGSLIVQVLIAIVVGALATIRYWKARALRLLGIRQEDDDADAEPSPDSD